VPQRFTSWGAIHRTLRAAFPDERYHQGWGLTGFDQADGDPVTVRFANGRAVAADLLVCADGWRSEARRRLLPEARPRYAGYVAWRGTLGEADAPADLAAFFADRFAFSEARSGGHALCYPIPGEGGSAEPGRRRLNWVWYVGVERTALDRLLTDRRGGRHEGSVPPGDVPLPLVKEVRLAAGRELHPRFAELIRATPEPFLQAVVDLAVPRMAFGRVCLVGDAAFVVRPHTAGATAKAAADAAALGAALAAGGDDPDAALGRWERERLAAGLQMVRYGVALGERFAAAR
jgi:2-polyprenyl-6-methoxyphenol hydroxylase-like FAD-dependent oxidoreductase